jgi:uncharacterized protein (TIGR02444 family)
LTINTDVSLWDFACTLYAKPGVAPTCLQLQDEYGFDIPLLLFCCWSGLRYGAVSVAQLQAAIDFTKAWTDQSVKPLRNLRRQMKSGYDPSWPLSPADWDSIRENVKGVELESERLLLKGLEILSSKWQLNSGSKEECLLTIHRCFSSINSQSPSIAEKLDTIMHFLVTSHDE